MKVSIVTVHLNDFAGLINTFRSLQVLLAKRQVEWLVVDGGSSVETEDQKQCFECVRSVAKFFISEPDKGIYDAMNKGACQAKGEYVLFLNAGDELHPDFDLEKLLNLARTSHPDMIWGHCQERYQNGQLIEVKTRSPSWVWYGMPAYHSTIFFKRKLLSDPPYNIRYKIAADYDLVCRLLSEQAQVEQMETIVSIFHRGGVSEVYSYESHKEENEIRLTYLQIPPIAGTAIKYFKGMNARLARNAWLRGLWRRWV